MHLMLKPGHSLRCHQYVHFTCTLLIVFGKTFEFCHNFKPGEKSMQQCSGIIHLTCLSANSGLSVPVMMSSETQTCQWLAILSKGVVWQKEQHSTKSCMQVIPLAPVLSMPKDL